MSTIHDIFKAFGKSIAVTIGIFFGLMPVFFLISLAGSGSSCFSPKTIFTCLPDLQGEKKAYPRSPAILRVNIHGVIGSELLTAEMIEQQLVESRLGPLRENRVKGIFLHINSPGGGINDTDIIYRNLLAYKKRYNVPVYAYIDGLCASGGMYIACSADKVISSPVGVIGSVGVRMGPFFNVVEGLDKLGIKARTLTEGKYKDMMNPFRDWKEGESRFLDNLSDYFYQRFITVVASARPKLTKEQLIENLGAGIFDPIEAEKLGYIDESNKSYEEAMAMLLEASDIDINQPYQIVELMPKKSWFAEMITKSPIFTGKIKHDWKGETMYNPFHYLFRSE